ncbi:uncharacterized protein LOC112603129 [Melanaphis sacchari]|uniref:uncharacterized protein LOC112603129 n=1 Tax=Melanaphis sacchari TaxID=742174 RepID=UPI000DC1334C|nr:uncharacterized protein LOC112603129 [Melanaphis sacchari]
MNGNTFYDWFSSILPLLKKNAVVVMDNAPYHSVKKETFPQLSWKKEKIIQWLTIRGNIIDQRMVKDRLLEEAQEFRVDCNKYVIDELAKNKNIIVLRLPPYHCELNPIELAWSSIKQYVKMNNTTFKLQDVKQLLVEGVERVSPDMWKNFISHVIKEEKKLCEIDFITDDILEGETSYQHVLTITGNISDSESDDFDDSDDDQLT